MRYELSDCEWSVIGPMLPNKPRGIPRVDDRRVLNGIFWVLRSGAPWRDLPGIYGMTAAAVELEIDGVSVKIARGADAQVIAAVIDALKMAR
jgi:transposase